MQTVTDHWREHRFDVDLTDLGYLGDRDDVADYLERHGWHTVATRG
jgi:O-methyltransferase involved in polyketide biosynthesis